MTHHDVTVDREVLGKVVEVVGEVDRTHRDRRHLDLGVSHVPRHTPLAGAIPPSSA